MWLVQQRKSEEASSSRQFESHPCKDMQTVGEGSGWFAWHLFKLIKLPTLWWTNIAMERSTIFNGKIHYKWPFSIAMLVHQRVSSWNPTTITTTSSVGLPSQLSFPTCWSRSPRNSTCGAIKAWHCSCGKDRSKVYRFSIGFSITTTKTTTTTTTTITATTSIVQSRKDHQPLSLHSSNLVFKLCFLGSIHAEHLAVFFLCRHNGTELRLTHPQLLPNFLPTWSDDSTRFMQCYGCYDFTCNAMAKEIWTQQLPDLCGIGSPSWADVWSCSTLSTVTCLSTRGQKFSEGTHEVACTKRCFIASKPSVWEGSSFRLKIAAAQLPRPVLANSCWFLWQTVGFTGGTKTMARFFPAFAHPPCAASLQIIAALPHNPNASQFCSVICTSLTAAKSQMNGTGIGTGCSDFPACEFAPHLHMIISYYFFFSHQDASVTSIMFLQLTRSPSLSPCSTRFPTLFSSHPLSLLFSPSCSTRATFETMLFWQCSDGNQALFNLWLPSKGKKAARQADTWALPGTAFISSCAALAFWPFRRSGNTVRHETEIAAPRLWKQGLENHAK